MDAIKKDPHEFTETSLPYFTSQLGQCVPLVMNYVIPFDGAQCDNPPKD